MNDDPDLLAEWAAWQLAGGLSPRTVEEREATVSRASRDCGGTSPQDLTSRQIITWLAAGTSWAKSTRATFHGHLKAWFGWLQCMGYRQDNPMMRVPSPRRPRGEPHPLSNEEICRLAEVLNRKRTRAMVMLAALAGLRVFEIAKVRGEDVNMAARTLTVTGKGGVRAVLPLHPQLIELAAEMPRTGWWFPSTMDPAEHMLWRSVSDTIHKALKRAGVHGSAHSLRHSFATSLVANGTDLVTAQHLLRHASLATTQVYVLVADVRKRDAINRLSPL